MMLGITSILSSWGAGTIGQSDWVSLRLLSCQPHQSLIRSR
jgi:NCS1 family nucleobase:cation symporter-1